MSKSSAIIKKKNSSYVESKGVGSQLNPTSNLSSLGKVVLPSPKIVINLPWVYGKLYYTEGP